MIQGGTASIYRASTSTARVANSQLIGPISPGVTCFNNYDENLDPVACP